uniref:Uncharacterized protein n=1 Tax=Acrobeloides nanus TaxID=290746 RepID=A0A914CT54_9BILA
MSTVMNCLEWCQSSATRVVTSSTLAAHIHLAKLKSSLRRLSLPLATCVQEMGPGSEIQKSGSLSDSQEQMTQILLYIEFIHSDT